MAKHDHPSVRIRAIQDTEGWTDETLLGVLLDALDSEPMSGKFFGQIEDRRAEPDEETDELGEPYS